MTDPNAELAAHAERLRGLADAATPGPWEAYRLGDPAGPFGVEAGSDTFVSVVSRGGYDGMHQGGVDTRANPALIAALGPDFARKTADQWDGIARRHVPLIGECAYCPESFPCADFTAALAGARTLTPADEEP